MKNTIEECLKGTGIQPSSFAYFLTEFQKKKPGKSKLSKLLTEQLKAQAELINYYLIK